MDFSRTLVKPAAFCLQPSHQRSLLSHSSLSGMEELRTCWSGCIYSVDPGISLASVFCYELMVEWMEKKKKKTSGYAWPWKATLFSYVFPSYVWMISLPAHLYLSPVTLPGSVLSFLHGAIVCPYMHAHTHSHPADFTVLRVELALRNQSFTVLKGSAVAGERLWCSQRAHFHLCQQTALSGPSSASQKPWNVMRLTYKQGKHEMCYSKLTLWRVEEYAMNKGTGTIPGKMEPPVTSTVGHEGPDSQFSPPPAPHASPHCCLCLLEEVLGWEFSLSNSSWHLVSCLAAVPTLLAEALLILSDPQELVPLAGQLKCSKAG